MLEKATHNIDQYKHNTTNKYVDTLDVDANGYVEVKNITEQSQCYLLRCELSLQLRLFGEVAPLPITNAIYVSPFKLNFMQLRWTSTV